MVHFNDPATGALGSPVGDFRLTTVPTSRKRVKVIALARTVSNAASDTIALALRRNQRPKLPLDLTFSGLAGGSYTLKIATGGVAAAAGLATEALANAVARRNAACSALG